jgi:hypothetical protein
MLLPMILLLLIACDDATSTSDTEHNGKLTAETRIDGWENDLVPIGDVAVSEDGTIILTQPQDGVLRFFDDQGNPVAQFGGRGDGPGEFGRLARLGWLADTLWVFDTTNRRITFISPSRTLVRVTDPIPFGGTPPPGAEGQVPSFFTAIPEGMAPDGSLIASLDVSEPQIVPEPFQNRLSLGKIRSDGVVEEVLAIMPPIEGAMPFVNRRVYGVSPMGDRVAYAMAAFDGEDAGTFQVTAIHVGGDTIFSRRYPFDPERVPASVRDSAQAARRESLRALDAVRRPSSAEGEPFEFYLALEALLVGTDGTIWIRKRAVPSGRPFLALEPTGEVIGTIVLPAGSRIGAATRDGIWAIEPDSVGVESVVRYKVGWQ